MTEQEANKSAANLRKFWASRGYQVNTWIVGQSQYDNGTLVYAVRSDMVNGLPRGWRKSA